MDISLLLNKPPCLDPKILLNDIIELRICINSTDNNLYALDENSLTIQYIKEQNADNIIEEFYYARPYYKFNENVKSKLIGAFNSMWNSDVNNNINNYN